MNLQELLFELRNNILRDASDEVTPSNNGTLWTDASLINYINDGQEQFAVRSCILRDETTPAVTRITLVNGQELYDLDPRVISVMGARTDQRRLHKSTYAGLFSNSGDMTLGDVRIGRPQCGYPRHFYTDRETGKIGLYPAPDEKYDGQTLILRVARKPLALLKATDTKAVPEIPSEYHLDILEWAAWRALRNHDTDAENMAKASAHKTRFNDALAELETKAKRLLAQDFQFDVRTNWSMY